MELQEFEAENLNLSTVKPTTALEENEMLKSQVAETEKENTSDSESNSDENTVPRTLTKRGTKRKRKFNPESPAMRKVKKNKMRADKHSVLPGCKSTCSRKCTKLFSEERRQCINAHYWKLSWHEQKMFVLHNSSRNEVKRRSKSNNEDCYKKMSTFTYFLKDKDDSNINVCKTFFFNNFRF